jgi:magnesium chelatase family protein
MNPCPCGYYNHPEKACICTPGQIQRYMARISGPLLDRIDLHVEILPVSYEKLSDINPSEASQNIRDRVVHAREIQEKRFGNTSLTTCNSGMRTREIHRFAQPDEAGRKLLKAAMEKLSLSARAYDRILKVARTIADLDACANVETRHVAEAIQYRTLDRGNWGQ